MGDLFKREYVYVGKTPEGERVLMSGCISAGVGEQETVTHETVTDPHCLSLTSAVFTGKKNIDRNYITGGATLEHLGRIRVPAPGWTLADVRELHRIGTVWHLNTVRAGCAHMDLPDDPSPEARRGITCPEAGYKYGAAWLVKPLPEDVEKRFMELMSQGETEDTDY